MRIDFSTAGDTGKSETQLGQERRVRVTEESGGSYNKIYEVFLPGWGSPVGHETKFKFGEIRLGPI
jgi:hypothetical protein